MWPGRQPGISLSAPIDQKPLPRLPPLVPERATRRGRSAELGSGGRGGPGWMGSATAFGSLARPTPLWGCTIEESAGGVGSVDECYVVRHVCAWDRLLKRRDDRSIVGRRMARLRPGLELVASGADEGGREMADSLSDAEVLEELKQWKVNRPSKPSRLLPKSSSRTVGQKLLAQERQGSEVPAARAAVRRDQPRLDRRRRAVDRRG